nr:RecName: Full=Snake venom metalloproteinase Bco22; Short=SVMP [Bothrops cotiara]
TPEHQRYVELFIVVD